MPKRRDDDEETLSNAGAYAVGGPGLLFARALGGYASSRSSLDDLGPAPIGSDPWLRAQVERALAAQKELEGSAIEVDAREAVVTLRGSVERQEDIGRAERAAGSIEGMKRLDVALEVRPAPSR